MFRRAMDFISGCFDLGWIAGCKVYILAGSRQSYTRNVPNINPYLPTW